MTTAEIVPATPDALAAIDPASREAAVTAYLSHARDQLALAVQATGPEAVAALKAEIATAAEATKQLGLSKEIQTDAQEMVRRAEYALGKAIRAGQDRGEIRRVGETTHQSSYERTVGDRTVVQGAVEQKSGSYKASAKDFVTNTDEYAAVYALTDGTTDSQFEAALADAKAEGNVSRANVVRKIQGVKQDGLTPVERLVKIREMAPKGYTSGQIAKELDLSESYVRDRARELGIEITADKVLAGTHRVRIDHNHILNHLTSTLEGLTAGLDRVDMDALDEAQMQYWADSLTTSMTALKRFVKQIKERAQ